MAKIIGHIDCEYRVTFSPKRLLNWNSRAPKLLGEASLSGTTAGTLVHKRSLSSVIFDFLLEPQAARGRRNG